METEASAHTGTMGKGGARALTHPHEPTHTHISRQANKAAQNVANKQAKKEAQKDVAQLFKT